MSDKPYVPKLNRQQEEMHRQCVADEKLFGKFQKELLGLMGQERNPKDASLYLKQCIEDMRRKFVDLEIMNRYQSLYGSGVRFEFSRGMIFVVLPDKILDIFSVHGEIGRGTGEKPRESMHTKNFFRSVRRDASTGRDRVNR